MTKQHHFEIEMQWTGNNGIGTTSYTSYERSYTIKGNKKPILEASADPVFRGEATKYNPEEMLIAAIASCHMLWFLHFCADAGIIVMEYTDTPTGILQQNENGGGQFSSVTLHPKIELLNNDKQTEIKNIHHKAHQYCFIANSLNFPVNIITE